MIKRPQVINQPRLPSVADKLKQLAKNEPYTSPCRIELFEQVSSSIGLSLAKKISERHPNLSGSCEQIFTENQRGVTTIIDINIDTPMLWHRLMTLIHSQTPSQGVEFLTSICLVLDVNIYVTPTVLLGRMTLNNASVSTFCHLKRIHKGVGVGVKYTIFSEANHTLPFAQEVLRFMAFANQVPITSPDHPPFETTQLVKSDRGENVQISIKQSPSYLVPDVRLTFYPYKGGTLPSYRCRVEGRHSRFSAFVYQNMPLLGDSQKDYIALYESLCYFLQAPLRALNVHLNKIIE